MNRRRCRRGERGQMLPLVGLALALLTGFTGLSIDLGHQFAQKRIGQSSVDTAAMAGANQLGQSTPGAITAPPAWNSAAVATAHDYIAANGFPTSWPANLGTACVNVNTATQLSETFFNSGFGGACTATTGFTTSVTVNVPPLSYAGSTLPTACNASLTPAGYPYNCVQVVVVQQVTNYIMQFFGFTSEYITTFATAYADPTVIPKLPSPIAVQLSQPTSTQKGCSSGCFTENADASRTTLACSGSDNCPTLLATGSGLTGAVIRGVDGSNVGSGSVHYAALASAGDIVSQDTWLTLCDPDPGLTCSNGSSGAAPQLGFMLAPNSSLYCTTPNGLNTAVGTGQACTQAGYSAHTQSGLKYVAGNQTSWSAPPTWTPPTVTPPATDCGYMILNGDPITTLLTHVNAACVPPVTEPYTIQPGKYKYIVINAGQYAFASGLYYITDKATVNSTGLSGLLEPNGIDHSTERAGATNDFDLCTPAFGVISCSSAGTGGLVTAGVWIGQGSSLWNYGATVPTVGTVCSGLGHVVLGTAGGGGGKTKITGSGVSFYFTTGSPGFVSTSAVTSISLSAPPASSNVAVGGEPVLFNVQSPSGYVHLDGTVGATSFGGIVYQAPGASPGGGVDIDPGLGPSSAPTDATLTGQVIAYRMATFGSGHGDGLAVDFSGSWGSGSAPPAGATSNTETSLLTVPANPVSISGGFETLHVQYNDETMMDAYDVSFSAGSYSASLLAGLTGGGPPATYPSDTAPMFANSTQASIAPLQWPTFPYVLGVPYYDHQITTNAAAVSPPNTFSTVAYASTSANEASFDKLVYTSGSATITVVGDWTWGPQNSIIISNLTTLYGHPRSDLFSADIYVTFPVSGSAAPSITVTAADGDNCGDVDTLKYPAASTAALVQ